MNGKITNAIVFLTGAAAGAAVAWTVAKKKYEQIANEEIASVKEVFSKKDTVSKDDTPESEAESEADSKTTTKYENLIKLSGYNKETNTKPEVKIKKEDAMKDHVYLISPEDFGEGLYGGLFLTYYADGILAYDVTGQIVEDTNDLVGPYALTSFGEYEEDMVWVRNDKDRVDLEIARSLKNYSDVEFKDSHSDEDEDQAWDEKI